MLNLIVKGKIAGASKSGTVRDGQETGTVELDVRVWRQGAAAVQKYLVTLDAYWWKRFKALDEANKYISFRCSDIITTSETDARGNVVAWIWLKGEEFYL